MADKICSVCGCSFANGSTFCAHRVGCAGNRRCLTLREMVRFGFKYSSERIWYYENKDPVWLFNLTRTPDGELACKWPNPVHTPTPDADGSIGNRQASETAQQAQNSGAGADLRRRLVVDDDALADRQERPAARRKRHAVYM